MNEMFMPSSSSRLYPRKLELRWIGKGIPTPLSQKMTLSGTEGSKWILLEYQPPGECMLSGISHVYYNNYYTCIFLLFSECDSSSRDAGYNSNAISRLGNFHVNLLRVIFITCFV